MKKIIGNNSKEKAIAFTRAVVKLDVGINISAGIVLTLMPGWTNELFFDRAVFPVWVWVVIGVGFLIFAGWQIGDLMQPGGFTMQNLRRAAMLAWMPVIALTIGLMSAIGRELLLPARVFLWAANGYMLLLGGLYWWAAEKRSGTAGER